MDRLRVKMSVPCRVKESEERRKGKGRDTRQIGRGQTAMDGLKK